MGLINYSGKEGNEYHQKRHKEIFGNIDLMKAWGKYSEVTYFRGISASHRALEIGSGTGINLYEVNKIADVIAVEPAEKARNHCRRLGIKTLSSIEELPQDSKFDYILMRHVLEHVEEPRKLLLQVKTLLTSGGKLIIVLPIECPYKKISKNDIDYHLYCWNRQAIKNLLSDIGYQVLEAKINWFNGRRVFLPFFKCFGITCYRYLMTLLGMIRLRAEIIVVAELEEVHSAESI